MSALGSVCVCGCLVVVQSRWTKKWNKINYYDLPLCSGGKISERTVVCEVFMLMKECANCRDFSSQDVSFGFM